MMRVLSLQEDTTRTGYVRNLDTACLFALANHKKVESKTQEKNRSAVTIGAPDCGFRYVNT